MSQQLVEPKSSYIIPSSIEVARDNPQKRYFKIFLLNNALTRTIDKFGTRFKIDTVDTIYRDVDSFIGRTVIPFNDKKAGKHVSPKDAGIYPHRFPSKMDYIHAANKFYDGHGKAKIINVFKPDLDTLAAARNDPSIIVDFTAFCETVNPGMVALLDAHKQSNEDIYVSPGLVAIDSYYTEDGIKVVTQFAGTHSHIVDEPAFTEPVATIRKHICNKDEKTCYFDLLTAAEEKDLFNNTKDKTDMSTNVGNENVGLTGVDSNTSNADSNNGDSFGVTSKTQVIDSKGQVKEEIKKDANVEKSENKKQEKKADEVEKVEKVEKKEKVEKVEKDEGKLTFTKDELKNYVKESLAEYKSEILAEVKSQAEQEREATAKTSVLGKYFAADNEELKETKDFYSTLQITSDQLARILEDSKYNTAAQKPGKRAIELTAASYDAGVRTTRNVNPTKTNDNNKRGSDAEMHYDPYNGSKIRDF